jgi:hypothetical protein
MSSNEDLTTWRLGLWILPLLPDKIPREIIDTGKRPRTIDATNTKQIVDFYKIKPLYINLPLQSGIPIKFFIAYSDDILREEVTEPSIVGKFCKFKSEYSSEVSSNGEIVDPQATEIEIITREEAQTIHNEIRESIGDEP